MNRIYLRTPAGRQQFVNIAQAKTTAHVTGWTRDSDVRAFKSFVVIEDYDSRIIHEYDAQTGQWYEVEMYEGVVAPC